MPIYFAWFTTALLSVGADARDQNLPQSGRLLYCVISGFLNNYPILGVFELGPLFQKPGVGIMSSTATCVLPMKLGPKPVTGQSNSSPKLSPKSKILFVSQESSADVVQGALGTGAQGFVFKIDAERELLEAVNAVLRGEQFV